MKVAFLGMGVMGFPMAGHLKKAGHDVTVYNRTAAKSAKWVETHKGGSAATPREAAKGAEIVFACVGNDDDLRSVVNGPDGAFAGMGKGTLFIDHTTASAEVARELAEAGAKPVIDAYARACVLLGPVGSGQLTKMVNQICIAGLVQGLAEAMNFAVKAGLDTGKVVEVISKGAAQSWQMENRANTMVQGKFDFGFAVDWMRKDLAICLDEAKRNGARLPVTALVDQFYAQVQQRGGNRWDTSSLMDLVARP
jgi:3-hydroxyisobutyrate dehydrogenase